MCQKSRWELLNLQGHCFGVEPIFRYQHSGSSPTLPVYWGSDAYTDRWCAQSLMTVFQLCSIHVWAKGQAGTHCPLCWVTVLDSFLFSILHILLLTSKMKALYYCKAVLRCTSNGVKQIIKVSWKKIKIIQWCSPFCLWEFSLFNVLITKSDFTHTEVHSHQEVHLINSDVSNHRKTIHHD